MKRTQNNSFDSQQVLSVIEQYSTALDLLDAYDHQTMKRPKGNEAAYVLTYEECMHVIDLGFTFTVICVKNTTF